MISGNSTWSGTSTLSGSGLLTITSGGSLSIPIGNIFDARTLNRSVVNNGSGDLERGKHGYQRRDIHQQRQFHEQRYSKLGVLVLQW